MFQLTHYSRFPRKTHWRAVVLLFGLINDFLLSLKLRYTSDRERGYSSDRERGYGSDRGYLSDRERGERGEKERGVLGPQLSVESADSRLCYLTSSEVSDKLLLSSFYFWINTRFSVGYMKSVYAFNKNK